MRYHTLAALLAFAASANANNLHRRHHDIAQKRQETTSSISSSSTSTSAPAATSASTATGTVSAATGTTVSGTTVSGSSAATTTSNTNPAATLVATNSDVPPLVSISAGMTSGTTQGLTTTYAPGSTPTYYSDAPALPSTFVFSSADWPAQDKLPDTNSAEVQEWLKELDGWDIPDITPTADGTCVGDPAAAAQAQSRGWWTCGGWTKDTDIVACPDKLTWGVSFDDGPAPYTPKLLSYLAEKDISATFFVVGSRVIERPQVLIEEYMSGHEISVHTWSHPHLTTLTNEQIVAELGWSRKAIKTVLGVTPTTMRPPYGDIDDRVRAISMAMGMVPIIWTRTPAGVSFDTFDWEVAGGMIDAPTQYQAFQNILGNATTIDTGFIVLAHDLYEVTVDLAVGYTLNAALTHNPAFDLKAIGQCSNIPTADLYRESNTNTSFPFTNTSSSGVDVDGDGSTDTSSGVKTGSSGSNSAVSLSTSVYSALSLAGLAVLGAIL